MATFVHPSLDPDSWNGITIGDDRSPGLVELPQFEVVRKIDEKPSPGVESFALTDKGQNCTDVSVTFIIWKPEHFPAFDEFFAKHLSPDKPLDRRNIEPIVHPSLYLAGIKQGYFFAAGSLKGVPGGKYACTCKFKEFNDSTKIGSGSKKPKLKPDYKGLGGKWTKEALDRAKNAEEVGITVGGSAKASTQKATAQTQAQLNKSAAAGNSNARFTKGVQDNQAQDW